MGNELQLLIESIPAHVVVTKPSGEVETVNRPTLEYFGKTLEELNGWKTSDIVHSDDLQHTIAAQRKGFETGRAYNVESRHRRADGVYRWFNVLGLPLLDSDGRILRWFHLISDIDDRKRAEEALRASEINLRQIIDSIPGFVFTLSPAGVVELVNRPYLKYFGKTVEEIRAWKTSDIVHRDDLSRLTVAFSNSMTTGTPLEDELRVRRADGVYRWFQARTLPVRGTDGRITAWYGLMTDIEDRKRAEEELRSNERNLSLLINAIPTLIHVLGTDASVLHVNKAVLDYTGLTLEDVRKADYRRRVFHPEEVERLRQERREGLARAVPFENEKRIQGRDSRYRWFLVRYNPLVEEGRVTRWYVTATEIESRKQEEERVRQENVRLEERTRIARELHDTLLQTCIGTSLQLGAAVESLPADSQVKPKFDRILQLMQQGIEEGRNAIQCLRSSGSGPLDLIGALSAVPREFWAQPGVDFRATVVGQQQPLRSTIQQEIYSIGREALVNALCHSRAKRIDLELECAERNLTIWVRDNGCGIDLQVLDTGRKGHWGLTGMRERAARIGGLLKISTNPNAGTEIELSIPSDVAFQPPPADLGRMAATSKR
jgi:PAS domain S-box-containing protein